MTQRCIYECDNCTKEIGKKNHITLMLSSGTGTGIAVYSDHPLSMRNWSTQTLPRNFLHFCSSKCIGSYFEKLLKGASKKK